MIKYSWISLSHFSIFLVSSLVTNIFLSTCMPSTLCRFHILLPPCFNEHNYLQFHPCHKWEESFLLYGWIVFPCAYAPSLHSTLISWQALSLLNSWLLYGVLEWTQVCPWAQDCLQHNQLCFLTCVFSQKSRDMWLWSSKHPAYTLPLLHSNQARKTSSLYFTIF